MSTLFWDEAALTAITAERSERLKGAAISRRLGNRGYADPIFQCLYWWYSLTACMSSIHFTSPVNKTEGDHSPKVYFMLSGYVLTIVTKSRTI